MINTGIMHEHLLKIMEEQLLVSAMEADLCRKYFEPLTVAKNTIIEEEGKIPRYLYFVVSGYMRLFHYNEQGDEVTTHINCPPGFITAYTSFTNQAISIENVECVTPCELLRISKKALDLLITESDVFKNFSIRVFQQSIAYNENRSVELANLSAEQRYQNLMKNYPDILQNVPLQYIASFLGMNAKSLSRIRKQLIK